MKMETLEQLIKRLKLKKEPTERRIGRLKTKNGYSYVCVNKYNEYLTYNEPDFCDDNEMCYIVRG